MESLTGPMDQLDIYCWPKGSAQVFSTWSNDIVSFPVVRMSYYIPLVPEGCQNKSPLLHWLINASIILPIQRITASFLTAAATESTRNAMFISLEYCQINKEGRQCLSVIHQTTRDSHIFSHATYKLHKECLWYRRSSSTALRTWCITFMQLIP